MEDITARSAAARRVLRELGKELEEASEQVGETVELSASERAVLDLILDDFDRISDLKEAYAAAVESGETKLQIKVSTELRLLEQSAARLLKQIETDLPAAEDQTTVKQRAAANVRWERDRFRRGAR
ncbi:hypothetical protein [Mycolicibacterium wolinskyi]|uniref:hypothetical protein n=1 Tax=Mycolicibacterium wolinskyi TaxID=59750 RepID=UPI003917875A